MSAFGGGGLPGATSVFTATPVVTAASAYAAGNEVGGLMTFSGFPPAGILQSIRLRVKSVQTAGFDLYLFGSNPTNTTWTDKTTPAIAAADVAACIGALSFTSAFSGLGTHTFYPVNGIGKAMAPNVTTIYGVLVTKGTPTFTATSDIIGVDLIFLPDHS